MVNLPFERISNYVAWYIQPSLPIVIPANQLVSIINECDALEPIQSMKLKMAVFQGIGVANEIQYIAQIFGKELNSKISNDGWPYTYIFNDIEAHSAFEAYTSAFCFCNKNIICKEFSTTVDQHVSYEFRKKRILGSNRLVSFSKDMIASVIGPSTEYFVGLTNGDYLFFGKGAVKYLHSDNLRELSEEPDYFELMSASYSVR